MTPALAAASQEIAAATEKLLDELLPQPQGLTAKLDEAMRYGVLGGGKRLRAQLAVLGADLFDMPRAQSLRVGAALEMLHGYSLIHDDLPCMDDDDLRRGKPTVHKAYDEAAAVLAGDALQTEAFAVLAEPATHADAGVRVALLSGLAAASGSRGMAGGQAIDLAAETLGRRLETSEIEHLQALKTGALIVFAAESGAILAGALPMERAALRAYGAALGLAFQIADDILDREGDPALVGKALAKDQAAGKATFVDLLGLEGARARAGALVAEACEHLAVFGDKAGLLRDLAGFVITRRA